MRTKNKAFLFLLALICVLHQKSLTKQEQQGSDKSNEPTAHKVSVCAPKSSVSSELDTDKMPVKDLSTPSTMDPVSNNFLDSLEQYNQYFPQDFEGNPSPWQWKMDVPQIDFAPENWNVGFIKTR